IRDFHVTGVQTCALPISMLAVMTAILLLGACGGMNAGGGDPLVGGSGPQDGSPDDLMPIGEGFEKYPVWVEVYEDPVRDTEIQRSEERRVGKEGRSG